MSIAVLPANAGLRNQAAPRARPMLRFLNKTLTVLRRMHVPVGELSEESILSTARRRAKLDDWGSEDFREPLRILMDSLERDAGLSALGRVMFRYICVQAAVNRLRIQNDFKQHPEILEVPIRRPLFVVGWPRTGTTLLHNLLSLDPAARAPRLWELSTPSPPPDAQTRGRDPRLVAMKRSTALLRRFAPEMAAAHLSDADAPEECEYLFLNAFAAQLFEVMADVPRYSEWLKAQDMLPQYDYYRRQLQLLTWRSPGEHLVLKAPHHLWMLDALLKTFPDACVVQTHRDPAKALPSACSLSMQARQFTLEHPDPGQLGNYFADMFLDGIERSTRCREQSDPERFCDVQYDQLVADPCGTVQRIYADFGYDLPDDMDARIRKWLDQNPPQKHGVHAYSLAQFGLDKDEILRRFESYVTRYHVTLA